MIGRHIGNYRIVTELGSGAMGDVYFAEHSVMGRRAAVKVIRKELSGNAEMVERFINEARLVNRIGHPNIVEITDFGSIDDRYYLMMELLEGETLEARLERKRHLDEPSIIQIGKQITAALSAAHDLGVVHRDLKPENIFLTNRGGQNDFVKVLDFGIAKLIGPQRASAGTVPGMLIGTPHYMSPEQCRGSTELDHRSDVYSLGVMLYRMITGALPFDGDTLLAVLYAQGNMPPRALRDCAVGVSAQLESLVLKALEKRPEHRFENMAAVARALDATANPPPLSATIALPRAKDDAQHEPVDTSAVIARTLEPDAEQGKRVGSRLARILVERIHKGRLVLPTMPATARECIELLNVPDGSLSRVSRAIERDPIVAPQVLRRARSALLGGNAQVRSIEQAVSRIGARQLRTLLVDLCARELFESQNPEIRRATRGLWEHSIAVATLARGIARRRKDADPEAAYLAGLLHDVGKPIAASLLLEAERTAAGKAEAWLGKDAWLDVIAECHREVGVALARAWDLQDEVVRAVARSERYSPESPSSTANIVCFANALVKHEGIYTGTVDREAVDALLREGMQLFRVEPEALEVLLSELPSKDGQARATP